MSTSFSTAPEATAAASSQRWWRIAVIGIVAALAVAIGLAAGMFLMPSRPAGAGGAAAYVPAAATFYAELRLEPSPAQDDALRELLGRFPAIEGLDLDRPLADQLAELLDDALGDDQPDLSWSEDVAPWTDGRLAIALLDLPALAFDPMADPGALAEDPPPVLILLGVTDPDAATSAVQRIVAETDSTTTTTEHRGVTIHAAADGEGAYTITDDQLIAAASVDDIVTALDTRSDGDTLAERDEVVSLVEALADDWLAFGVWDMTDAMASALEVAGTESAASAAAMARILEHQPLRGAFAVSATAEGLAFDAAGAAPTGPFAVENAERGLAGEVPSDALFYSEGGNLGLALAELIGTIKEAAAAEPDVAEQIGMAEAALGADLDELLAWIDDGALVMGFDGTEPYAGVVLVPSDVDAADRRLDQLATFAGLAAFDPGSGLSLSEDEVAGVTVTTIRWADPATTEMLVPMAPTSLSVQYAITTDRVLVGIGERFVARALELEAADSLAGEPRFTDAVAGVGGPDAAGISWIDIAGIVEAASQVAGPMLEGAEGAEGADQALEWLAPLDRIVSVGRLEGDVLVQRSILLIR